MRIIYLPEWHWMEEEKKYRKRPRKEAVSLAPWACKVIKVEGGWMAFESIDDYAAWKRVNDYQNKM